MMHLTNRCSRQPSYCARASRALFHSAAADPTTRIAVIASTSAIVILIFFHSLLGGMFFGQDTVGSEGILVGVTPIDPIVLLIILSVIAGVSGVTFFASLSATRIEPTVATRL